MPLEASSNLVQAYVPGTQVKVYDNAAHGLYYTSASKVMKDILEHIKRLR